MSPPHGAFLMIALIAAGLAGCNSGPAVPQPIGTETLPLAQDANRTMARVKIGYELTLELPPVPVPGHAWKIMSADVRFVKQMSEIKPAVEGGRPQVNFLTLRTGRTIIRFLLLPAGRTPEADPIDHHSAILTIE
ncbi:MAG: hypothetical protein WD941_06715 [Opitutus sp.]